MKIISYPRNLEWATPDKTAINITVDTDVKKNVRMTVTEAEYRNDWGRLISGEFGRIAPYREPERPDDRYLEAVANFERVKRVSMAYGNDEKRMSLYGYMALLGSKEKRTEEEKAELDTLQRAAAWEEDMIKAVPAIVKAGEAAIHKDSSWPDNPVAIALLDLAKVS